MLPKNDRVAVAVSTPGGMARQFRVQYQTAPQAPWEMYATFRTRELAACCMDRLRREGYEARIVDYSICPAAG